jgi:RNA polymerase sigma-70 factor (ECF subfamily)
MGRDASTPAELLAQAQAQAGEAESLGQLLEVFRGYLTLLARTRIGQRLQGKVDAADLVQDTFLQAHQNWDRFQGTTVAELLSWLRRILDARIIDLMRYFTSQSRDVRLELPLDWLSQDLTGGLLAKQDSPSKEITQQEQGVLLASALALLPEDYREVLILRHLECLTFPEVAQRMERTLASVKKLWVRALERLRHSLKSDQ